MLLTLCKSICEVLGCPNKDKFHWGLGPSLYTKLSSGIFTVQVLEQKHSLTENDGEDLGVSVCMEGGLLAKLHTFVCAKF